MANVITMHSGESHGLYPAFGRDRLAGIPQPGNLYCSSLRSFCGRASASAVDGPLGSSLEAIGYGPVECTPLPIGTGERHYRFLHRPAFTAGRLDKLLCPSG
jgi:hypothetical protein